MAPNPESTLGATKKKDNENLDLTLKQLRKSFLEKAQSCDPYSQWKALAKVRKLVEEIKQLYAKQYTGGMSKDEQDLFESIWPLEIEIVNFFMQHNAELEAIDFLVEIDLLEVLHLCSSIRKENCRRICLYLTSLERYFEDLEMYGQKYKCRDDPNTKSPLREVHYLCMKFEEYPDALRIALFLKCPELLLDVFKFCHDGLQKKQLCYILARHGQTLVLAENDDDRLMMQGIINNEKLSEGYLTLARYMEVMEPKSPEDVYKAALVDARDSAFVNPATYVNAFVNAGFGQDKFMTVQFDSSKDDSSGNGITCEVASLGMILLWDVDTGLAQIDKYLYSDNKHVSSGALLAIGILNCHIKHENDPAKVLILKHMNEDDPSIMIPAVMGLGIAYANSCDIELRCRLESILKKEKVPLDVIAFTAISLGLICVGSHNENAANAIISALRERSESDLEDPLIRFLPLGLGLLFLGTQEWVEEIAKKSNSFNRKISKYSEMTLLSCAYAGTGNVFEVQKLLAHCSQRLDKGEIHQGPAVLGLAMMGMAEEIGIEMTIRSLEHLLQYGEQNIRRVVPLALGLLCLSNPRIDVVDILKRLSHDLDSEIAMAAVISLGLIGAGTNNARISILLRNLSSYYDKDPSLLVCVRISQGLLHLGKGLLTLNPYHSDRFLLHQVALAGILIMLHACLDMKAIILGDYHYVLYFLVLAMQPKMLMTVDENLKPLSVPVRVGRAVDVVGLPGSPRTITGFRNLSTPVLLGPGDRAELATKKRMSVVSVTEYMNELEVDSTSAHESSDAPS